MSIPFCNWVINNNNNNIIIIQLDNININSDSDAIIYNVKIITLECLSSVYPDPVYKIKIPI